MISRDNLLKNKLQWLASNYILTKKSTLKSVKGKSFWVNGFPLKIFIFDLSIVTYVWHVNRNNHCEKFQMYYYY